MEEKMSISILVADDHAIVRQALVQALNQEPGFEVVADVPNGYDAVSKAHMACPDVVVMDVNMPGLNGIESTRRILDHCRETRVLGLSMHKDDLYVLQMLKAGAAGFILKTCAFPDLIKAIRTVYEGKTYLCSEITGCVIHSVLNPDSEPEADGFSQLTSRDRQILQMIAEGSTSREIASRLSLSKRTVDMHRSNIMDKLNLHSVASLTKFALKHGITTLET